MNDFPDLNPLANRKPVSDSVYSVWCGVVPTAPAATEPTTRPYVGRPGVTSRTARKSLAFPAASPAQTNRKRVGAGAGGPSRMSAQAHALRRMFFIAVPMVALA